jgi:hypothetical protein
MGAVGSLWTDEQHPAVHLSDHQRQPDERTWLQAADEAGVLNHLGSTAATQMYSRHRTPNLETRGSACVTSVTSHRPRSVRQAEGSRRSDPSSRERVSPK